MPLSNDTSRSPIPIDPETYKNMHKDLPKRMDASSNANRSRSRDHSLLDRSISSNEQPTLDARKNTNVNYTQVQPFIMSPQNLQETLKKQQE